MGVSEYLSSRWVMVTVVCGVLYPVLFIKHPGTCISVWCPAPTVSCVLDSGCRETLQVLTTDHWPQHCDIVGSAWCHARVGRMWASVSLTVRWPWGVTMISSCLCSSACQPMTVSPRCRRMACVWQGRRTLSRRYRSWSRWRGTGGWWGGSTVARTRWDASVSDHDHCLIVQVWLGGYDWYPCQHQRYLRLEDGWINNTTYCGGAADQCTTYQIVTIPHATMPSPGLIRLEYDDEPLLPQVERWHIVARPRYHETYSDTVSSPSLQRPAWVHVRDVVRDQPGPGLQWSIRVVTTQDPGQHQPGDRAGVQRGGHQARGGLWCHVCQWQHSVSRQSMTSSGGRLYHSVILYYQPIVSMIVLSQPWLTHMLCNVEFFVAMLDISHDTWYNIYCIVTGVSPVQWCEAGVAVLPPAPTMVTTGVGSVLCYQWPVSLQWRHFLLVSTWNMIQQQSVLTSGDQRRPVPRQSSVSDDESDSRAA